MAPRPAQLHGSSGLHAAPCHTGFREACECARKVLEDSTFNNVSDPVRFRADLMNIAKTTLSSKILTGDKEHFANLAVDAILRLKGGCSLVGVYFVEPGCWSVVYWLVVGGRQHCASRGLVFRGRHHAGPGVCLCAWGPGFV